MSKRPNWVVNSKVLSGRSGGVLELEEFISASFEGRLEKLKEILRKHPQFPDSAYIDGKSQGRGETALHKAVDGGHKDVVEFLLKKHKSAVDNRSGTGGSGETPLHRAAYHGDYDIAKLLLDAGADPDSSTSGRTPVYLAKCNKHPRVEELLIEEGGTPVTSCSQRAHHGGGTRRRGRGRKATRRVRRGRRMSRKHRRSSA